MINSITKQNIGELISDIESNLDMLGQYYGIQFVLSKKKYSDVTISFSVDGQIKNSTKVKMINDAKLNSLGLPPDAIGSNVKISGIIFKVDSIDSRKPKYPVIIKNSKGGIFKISVSQFLQNKI